MTDTGTENYKAARRAKEKSGDFGRGSVELDYSLRSEFAGVSPVNSTKGPPSLFCHGTVVTLNALGPGEAGAATRGAGSKDRGCQQPASCAGPPQCSPGGGSRLVYCHFY